MREEQLVAAEVPPRQARRTRSARVAWYAFLGLAVIFTLCVAAQVFIAGLAVFVTPVHWARHTAFVHIFEFVPLLMLVVGAVGRLPARLRWRSAALFALVYAQYVTANIGGIMPLVAALHPVVALIIFWLSAQVVQETRRAMAAMASAGA